MSKNCFVKVNIARISLASGDLEVYKLRVDNGIAKWPLAQLTMHLMLVTTY